MELIKNNICVVLGFVLILTFGSTFSLSTADLQQKYHAPISILTLSKEDGSLHSHEAMSQIFTCFDQQSHKLFKEIRSDIKVLRKSSKDRDSKALYEQLRELQAYIKKHRVAFDTAVYHAYLKNRYQKLFDMVAADEGIVDFIDKEREQFGIAQGDAKFMDTFLKEVRQACHKISKFEDYLHANYIDLKMMNYVFKIDLVRLRNAVLFSDRYKESKQK